ncbi:hypothetical protein VOLCADRAFT_100728 [Volvox carteri f. nagariensis]|uniref:Uncharacterized protein n=1 Tax=Volvox carteri f. nagariensis TaxID=3068 RepID=D8UKW1_VOLCA|nr:uncharacterized protein VOLCADRAFT_100728 [Volvox carteri f. nagariensis]EFJ39641.1 hypothetical protein VOLCADRAFT_100728 [Volvox carteri f. nagariensis]|eukprot:XP_002959300.1 hypothetical protein VOLCADRAFT_100728 [Volvox carteri f. nagariensis]
MMMFACSIYGGHGSLGWRNFGYNLGDMTAVGLRISEPSRGHYSDITFLLMLGDLSSQPVVSSITVSETGQVLPQYGGNIFVYVGVPVTLCMCCSWPLKRLLEMLVEHF